MRYEDMDTSKIESMLNNSGLSQDELQAMADQLIAGKVAKKELERKLAEQKKSEDFNLMKFMNTQPGGKDTFYELLAGVIKEDIGFYLKKPLPEYFDIKNDEDGSNYVTLSIKGTGVLDAAAQKWRDQCYVRPGT